MAKAIARAVLVLAILCVAGCAGGRNINTQPMTQNSAATAGPAAPAAPVPPPDEMRLDSGDKVRVAVVGADTLNGEYDVDLSGSIGLPLIGAVAAAGNTPKQLEAAIARKLRDQKLMDNPQISVGLVSGRPFYALGEVKSPGEYPYRAGLNIINAVATAGGFTNRAEQEFVFLRRAGQPDELKVPLASAMPMGPGDIIRVPLRVF